MIKTAINSLCEMLSSVPAGDIEEWETKAGIIGKFAVAVSDTILTAAGLVPKSDAWAANALVDMLDDNNIDSPPADFVADIYLICPEPTLSRETIGSADFHLIFGHGRVMDWIDAEHKPFRGMSYEDAAVFICLWLQMQILRICMANQQIQNKSFPNLYDRLETFTSSLATECIEVKDNPITDIRLSTPALTSRFQNAMNWYGVKTIPQFISEFRGGKSLYQIKNVGRGKVYREVLDWLAAHGYKY
jgi:hypothetical protein